MAFRSIGFLPIPLETPRLRLLPLCDQEQVAAACRIFRTSDIRLAFGLPEAPGPGDLCGRLHAPPLRLLYLLQQARCGPSAGVLLVRRRADGSGYWQVDCGILPPFRRRGYAREAAARVIRRLFMEPAVAGVLARVPGHLPDALALAAQMLPDRTGAGAVLEFRLPRETWATNPSLEQGALSG